MIGIGTVLPSWFSGCFLGFSLAGSMTSALRNSTLDLVLLGGELRLFIDFRAIGFRVAYSILARFDKFGIITGD